MTSGSPEPLGSGLAPVADAIQALQVLEAHTCGACHQSAVASQNTGAVMLLVLLCTLVWAESVLG